MIINLWIYLYNFYGMFKMIVNYGLNIIIRIVIFLKFYRDAKWWLEFIKFIIYNKYNLCQFQELYNNIWIYIYFIKFPSFWKK